MRPTSQDTDAKLEASLNIFLAPVLLKAMSPDARVRGKVMEILGHINKVGFWMCFVQRWEWNGPPS